MENILDTLESNREALYKEPDMVMLNPNIDEFSKPYLRNVIENGKLSEYELATVIKNNIESIADDIMNGDTFYSPYLVDPNFIKGFTRAISSIPIGYKERILCNRITYDYFTSDNPNQTIKEQYLNISRIVNQDIIRKLQTIGLDENTACNLALCRYSSANEKTNVKRLNFAIYNRDPEVMTEQTIVWIYEKLFTSISDLFYATMFEVYHPDYQKELSESFLEIYGAVGLAVLCILNNMKSVDIQRVLIGYHSEWEYRGKPPVRFGLNSLSADYSRITRVVEYLATTGIYIP